MQSGKVRTGEDIGAGWIDTTDDSIERAKARLVELAEIKIPRQEAGASALPAPNPAKGEIVAATWYGNEFRGSPTASGEIFNPDGLTAAHKSLPFGTCLEVGNPRTRKSVIVRVNDRGPFTEGMTLDLSAGAARAIGMRSTQKVLMKRC